MSERMAADLVGNALTMALWKRVMPTGVIAHSDRASQYCSELHPRLLKNTALFAV